ncbi:MAG: fumarylacetoacetate hydrolase family protein [Pigmentiphaga sp.]|uniref:fumarylacetoacetate hydrolase family protein n=1 Tax=Pigmentiphaga sp. TaxID=1977564 RepID=UPI0029B0B6EF|nr:fumarylacetoacetate hydrolase family protein [Pigmentiphaga sp.]MDX3906147.1 fumarylacetoacetate hydrolase family protein [Pigmentiphaga sp.]
MKLATIELDGHQTPALLLEDGRLCNLHALAQAAGPASLPFPWTGRGELTMADLAAGGAETWAWCRDIAAKGGANLVPPGSYRLAAPVPRPPKNIFCLGRNYIEHVQEDNVSRNLQTQVPEHPQFFTKPWTSIVPHEAPIRYDQRVTRRLDYEVELAVIIGKGGRDIPADDAYAHVFGYSILNDVSARDLQKRHDQWFKGKALDGNCPFGPWIVAPDEIGDPHALAISLTVNGEPRQNASTGDMIFTIPRIIESLSAGLTLEPGDVIATGTPSGVGYAMNPRQWLKDGDLVECTIEKIGTLSNRVMEVR